MEHEMRPVRVGVVGVGRMGQHHARVYAQHAGAVLLGVCDADPTRAREVAERVGTTPFPSLEALLAQGVEAVSVAVPPSAHREVALAVIRHGVHLLVEKPLAATVEDGVAILRAARKKGVLLSVGHVERFNPAVGVLRNLLRDEEVVAIHITRAGPVPPQVKDVGAVVDLGVHDIDLIRFLSGSEVERLSAFVGEAPDGREDAATMVFQLRNGVLAKVHTNWLTPFKTREIQVLTRRKMYRADLVWQRVTSFSCYGLDGTYTVKEEPVPFAEPLQLELGAFLRAVRRGAPVEVTGEDGLHALRIAQRCLQVAKAGRAFFLPAGRAGSAGAAV